MKHKEHHEPTERDAQIILAKKQCQHCHGSGFYDITIIASQPTVDGGKKGPFVLASTRCAHTEAFALSMRTGYRLLRTPGGIKLEVLMSRLEKEGMRFFPGG